MLYFVVSYTIEAHVLQNTFFHCIFNCDIYSFPTEIELKMNIHVLVVGNVKTFCIFKISSKMQS